MTNGSYALTAMVLIALDHHEGRWCSLSYLADRVMAPMDVVKHHCDELVDQDQIEAMQRDSLQYYGVRITSDQPELVQ